jgi:hypothetical protein
LATTGLGADVNSVGSPIDHSRDGDSLRLCSVPFRRISKSRDMERI